MTHERSGPDTKPDDRTGMPAREPDAPRPAGGIPSATGDHVRLRASDLLALQQRAGNRAVGTLVQRVIGGTTTDPHMREATNPDVTGRYEIATGSPHRITLQLNQAGLHLRGWWQTHAGGRDLARFNITGWLDEGASSYNRTVFGYERPVQRGPEVLGTLTGARRGGGVAVEIDDPEYGVMGFERRTSAPRLSEEAIAGSPEETRELVRATETAPLDRRDEAILRTAAADIRDRLVSYLGTGQEGLPGRTAALNVNQAVNGWMEQLAPAQRPGAVARLQEYLGPHQLRVGSLTRPAWDWLQVMVVTQWDQTGDVRRHFGWQQLRAGSAAAQYRYRYQFSVRGLAGDVGVGLGGFLGTFDIERLPGPGSTPGWGPTEFWTMMGQVSGGLSAGFATGQRGPWTEFGSPFPWASGSFRGPYMILGAQAGAAIPTSALPGQGETEDIGGSYGAGVIIFEGDGAMPSIMADAGGFQRISGASLGADVSLVTGYLLGGRGEAIDQTRRPPATAVSSHRSGTDFHFAVDDPTLSAVGRSELRRFCATHRAAFESSGSTLHIDGYASTTGGPERNEQLSRLRAQNVLNAIRDILGPAYRIRPPRGGDAAIAEGHGESPHAEALRAEQERRELEGAWSEGRERPRRRAGEEAVRERTTDEVEDPEWRRVDVTLNGVIVLTLR